jgi:hypothetical protein
VTNDDRAGEEVERLIRTAGFEPVKAGGIEERVDPGWAATFTISSSAPQRRDRWSAGPDRLIATPSRFVSASI